MGVGSGFTGRLAMGRPPVPWAEVEHYTRVVQALLRGEQVEWEGAIIQLIQPDERFGPALPVSVPWAVAGEGPKGTRVARDLGADLFRITVPEPDFGRQTMMVIGTVLDDGEDPGSERVLDAAGHAAALYLHWAVEHGVIDELLGEGGHVWAAAYDGIPENVRHIALHDRHVVGVNDIDRPFVTGEVMVGRGRRAHPDQWRDRLAELEKGGCELRPLPARRPRHPPRARGVRRRLRPLTRGEPRMDDLQFIEWHEDGPIATAWLDRPPVNATDQQLYSEIRTFFRTLPDRLTTARVVVLAGRGKHFCAGNDLAEFQTLDPDNAPERLLVAREAFWAIYDSPYPVIAAVHGVAVGSGLAIAASCDLVVAAEGARFATPEVNVGVLGGAKHLSRLVPQGMVRLMHYTGDLYPPSSSCPTAASSRSSRRSSCSTRRRRWRAPIARHSPVTLRLAKRSLNGIEYSDLKTGYEFEQGLTRELSGYEDSKEAVNAFLDRRTPVYTGR